ncbi:MAG: hypothetical protein ACI90M_004005, partial [Candidatus Azotimanducaceae bacterium]
DPRRFYRIGERRGFDLALKIDVTPGDKSGYATTTTGPQAHV